MSDKALFAIENWLRRSSIEVPPGKREEVVARIWVRMQMEQQKQFFEHRAIPRGIIGSDTDE